MTDKELINPKDNENCFDNPTLQIVEAKLINVQSKNMTNNEFPDPCVTNNALIINSVQNNADMFDDSSNDSIEILNLEENLPRPTIIPKRQVEGEQNDSNSPDEKCQEKKEKQSKGFNIIKKKLSRKESINIFEENNIFWDLIENPKSNLPIIDPRIELIKFLFTPPPKDVVVKCQLNKTNKKDKTNIFSKFIFSLQICRPDENEKRNIFTLMAARSRKKSRNINYIISTDASEMKLNSSAIIGKMKGNFIGSKFIFYQNKRPVSTNITNEDNDENSVDSESEPGSINSQNKCIQFNSLGAAFYKGTSLIKRKPREVDAVIPKWDDGDHQYYSNLILPNDRNKLSTSSDDSSYIDVFNNINPIYDKDNKCFTLNFGGRAKMISSKNFALRSKIGDKEKRVYQFGKCKDHYIIDYTYPLCAFQAFAIGLSSCHRKIASD